MTRLHLHLPRVAVVPVLVVLAVLALPATTLASQPQTFIDHVNDTFVDQGLSDFCGFPIQFHVEGTIRVTYWEDPSGPALYKEIQVYPTWAKSWTNLDTGTSVSTRGPSVIHITVNADESATIETTGLTIGFQQPGEGVAFIDTGRLTVFFSGPDDQDPDVTQTPPSGDGATAICTLLA